MACLYFFIVDDGITSGLNLFSSPSDIFQVTKIVLSSTEHCHWNITLDIGQVDQRWRVGAIMNLVGGSTTPVIKNEFTIVNLLSIMDQTLNRCATWEVTHIDIKPIFVVKSRVLGDKEAFSDMTNIREVFAGELHDR